MVQVIPIQPKKAMIDMSIKKLGTIMEEIIMMIYRKGTFDHISIILWKIRSNLPPQNPIALPMLTPIR